MVHGYHLIIDESADRQWNHQHRRFPTELKKTIWLSPYQGSTVQYRSIQDQQNLGNLGPIRIDFLPISWSPYDSQAVDCNWITWMWLLFTFFGMFKCTGLVKKKWIGIKRSWIRWIYQNLNCRHHHRHNRHHMRVCHHYLVVDCRNPYHNNLYGRNMDIHWNILCDMDTCQNIGKLHGNRF